MKVRNYHLLLLDSAQFREPAFVFFKGFFQVLFTFYFNFWSHPAAYGLLIPQPGIEPAALALKARVLDIGLLRKSPSQRIFPESCFALWSTHCAYAWILLKASHSVIYIVRASLIAQIKNLPEMQETPIPFLGWEDLLEKG